MQQEENPKVEETSINGRDSHYCEQQFAILTSASICDLPLLKNEVF
jgi:hypothetical protein